MQRRYLFEILLAALILGGVIATFFYL
ncbi:small membrane protein YdgU [Serratia symbiotica]